MPPPLPITADSVAVKLFTVFALVLINGFFVASEFVLVASRKTRIDQMAAEGNRSARVVQEAMGNLGHFFAATQIGVTVSSLVLGGLGERTLEPLLQPMFAWMPTALWGVTRVGVATGFTYFVMTSMHVVIGELMPKAIALHNADGLALILVHPLSWFARLVTPLIWLLNGLGTLLLRLIHVPKAQGHDQVHSAEELDMLFLQAHEGGEINKTELDILHRVVRFSDVTAREVMVPRVEILALPRRPRRAEIREFLRGQPRTRVPVYEGSLDEIIGILHLKDLVRVEAAWEPVDAPGAADDGRVDLGAVAREAVRVPETISIDRLLVEFKNRRQLMAIVIDEYGGTAGLVTMGDLLDQVFGDVHDEFDRPDPDIEIDAAGLVILSGRTLIDTVNERFDLHLNAVTADTVAGLVIGELGRPAKVGDTVEQGGVRLEVIQVDRLRVTRLAMYLPVGHEQEGAIP